MCVDILLMHLASPQHLANAFGCSGSEESAISIDSKPEVIAASGQISHYYNLTEFCITATGKCKFELTSLMAGNAC